MKGRYGKVGNVSSGAFLIEESASLVILASGPVYRDLTGRRQDVTLDEIHTRWINWSNRESRVQDLAGRGRDDRLAR
ncbi:hypothetical protein AAHA92_08262 [Salvia divinorum]|uniref:Uncharacterized protein n=1 Tax=Salvia divinorum TaxID=28513 RepID=A0ABD1HNP3_SALDI